MKRSKLRILSAWIAFLFFPITLNFFSPYVSIDGAMNGIIAGSVIVFGLMAMTALFFRRAWCSYLCPLSAVFEASEKINDRNVNRKRLSKIRYVVFAVWFAILVVSFIFAGGIKSIQPLYLTETGISVDLPIKFVTYYMVVFAFFGITAFVGKRGACHSICWMSPFLTFGSWLGNKLHFKQYQVVTQADQCIACSRCDKECPMSIDVMHQVKQGKIGSLDCINCGRCVDVCPKKVLELKFK